jgi:hypothetical protein
MHQDDRVNEIIVAPSAPRAVTIQVAAKPTRLATLSKEQMSR